MNSLIKLKEKYEDKIKTLDQNVRNFEHDQYIKAQFETALNVYTLVVLDLEKEIENV